MPDHKSGEFRGNRNLKRLKRISQKKHEEEIGRPLHPGRHQPDRTRDADVHGDPVLVGGGETREH